MAYYDVDKDKIVGAKRGSLAWWHERGHQVFHKLKFVKTIYEIESTNIMAFIYLSFILSNFWPLAVVGSAALGYRFADELIAWHYAIKHYRRK